MEYGRNLEGHRPKKGLWKAGAARRPLNGVSFSPERENLWASWGPRLRQDHSAQLCLHHRPAHLRLHLGRWEGIVRPEGKGTGPSAGEQLGFIFQDCNLLDTLTAFENIALALSIVRTPAGEIQEQVEENARLLGIRTVWTNTLPDVRRAAAALRCGPAIVTRAALVLADEPTGALDSRSARMLLERLEELNQIRQTTILMVTHDAFTASCHRVIFLRRADLPGTEPGRDGPAAFFAQIIR